MLVCGSKTNDEQLHELCKGTLDECKKFCKSIIPFEWDSVNIDKDNGEIVLRIVKNGRPASDYHQLIEPPKKRAFAR